MNHALTSSNKQDWGTPTDFFSRVNSLWNLNKDVCASDHNHKLPDYWTEQQNALERDWTPFRCWMNPPYKDIEIWLKKANDESLKGCLVVALIPYRPDTKWWSNYVRGKGHLIEVIGRLKFEGADASAPFPSALVVYHNEILTIKNKVK